MPETMNFDSIFNLEDLTRELAESYSKGHMTTDEYLTMWEDITRAFVTPSEA